MTELHGANPATGRVKIVADESKIDSDVDSDDSLLDILNSLDDSDECWSVPVDNPTQNSRDSGVGHHRDDGQGVTESESDEDRSSSVNCFDAVVENTGDVIVNGGNAPVESVCEEEVMERDGDVDVVAKAGDNNIDCARGVVRSHSVNSDSSDNIITQFLDKSVEHVGCSCISHA